MFLNFVSICFISQVVSGGCVKDPALKLGYTPDGEAHVKDVELISKDLKFKFDFGLEKRELLEKTLEALKAHFLHEHEIAAEDVRSHVDETEHKVEESHAIDKEEILKSLQVILGSEFKVEELTEEDLKSVMTFFEHLLQANKEALLKANTEGSEKIRHADKTFSIEKDEELSKSPDDIKTYLAESMLHLKVNKDAEVHHGIDEEALKKSKISFPEETIPYFLMDEEAKSYFKSIAEGKGSVESDIHLKAEGGKEAFEESLKLLKVATPHGEATEEVGFKKMSADVKALDEHTGFHKEELVNQGKDHLYDEILKKEESHEAFEDKAFKDKEEHEAAEGYFYSEEKLHGAVKAFRESKALEADGAFHIADEHAHGKAYVADQAAKDLIAKSAEAEKFKKGEEISKSEKDLSIEDILKEDGYYITGGTHAYEAARDKAYVDAKIPVAEEKHKGVDVGIIHEEDQMKIHKATGAGSEFAKGKEAVLHGMKGKDEILKEETVHGLAESHSKHGIKTDPTHLIHDARGVSEERRVLEGGKIDHAEEGSHSKALAIKQKLLSFLGKMLHLPKCHLVTMPPSELLKIVDCISRSKNPLLCEKFAVCETKMPLQVILALEKCQKEIIPGAGRRCSVYEPLYPSRDIPLKIFKCIVKNTHELLLEEKKQMIDFEECAREVKFESCGRFFPWG
ncbi:uncharacterized protein TNCT_230501 [Trichonephila clavata]|uniref:Uncharacterized protein n=1 Tax=Trichonephila clavata TaxID=2740835 RepID=A0A8X6GQL3_TRICU|nr:uncharacterized protein TNCT_230501 [Trichonephila clavata]